MFESLRESVASWHAKNDDRAKLQHTYIVSAFALLVAAGIVGLMNRDLGQNILIVSVASASIFLVNAVVWSLVQSAIISRAAVRTATKTTKK